MRDLLRGSVQLLAISWRQSRAKTAVSALLLVSTGLCGPLLAVALRAMINAALAGQTGTVAAAALVAAVLAIAMLTLGHFAHVVYSELSEFTMMSVNQELINLSNGSVGLAHHDRPDYADRIVLLEQHVRELSTAFQSLVTTVGLVLALQVTAVLLVLLHPALLLLPLIAVPPLLAGRRAERIVDKAATETTEQTRLALGFFHLATASGPAKELRVFRMRDELLARHRNTWRLVTGRLWRAHVSAVGVRAIGQVVFAAGYVGAVLLVVADAVAGRRTVGDVVLVVTLAAQVNQQVAGAVALSQELQRLGTGFRRLSELRAEVAWSVKLPECPAPDRLSRGIDLIDVGFAYPGSADPVLRHVTLLLPAGATVAIVGENGAGKSSLVKLLCGFYRPSSGRILVDGVDLLQIPMERWRQRTAAGFQDFVQFEFLAREVVGVGDLPRLAEDHAIRDALGRAQGGDVLEALPEGLDSQLGKSHSDGVELSTGQWQRLALGRAFMRQRPLLLVLDEPTAALDPQAEHALFERYADQAKRVGRATGGITVLVSHRFSTVRSADLIVVLADGRLAEVGRHADLVALGGIYAELFELQADAYR